MDEKRLFERLVLRSGTYEVGWFGRKYSKAKRATHLQGEQGAGRDRAEGGGHLWLVVTESPGAGNRTVRVDGNQRN